MNRRRLGIGLVGALAAGALVYKLRPHDDTAPAEVVHGSALTAPRAEWVPPPSGSPAAPSGATTGAPTPAREEPTPTTVTAPATTQPAAIDSTGTAPSAKSHGSSAATDTPASPAIAVAGTRDRFEATHEKDAPQHKLVPGAARMREHLEARKCNDPSEQQHYANLTGKARTTERERCAKAGVALPE